MGEVLTALKECIVRFFDRLNQPKIDEKFEFFRASLEAERYRVDKLIEKLTAKPETRDEQTEAVTSFKQVNGYMPWHVKQQMLERDSRKRAEELRAERVEKMSTEQLEKELGIAEQVKGA